MFTGLVEATGLVQGLERRSGAARLSVATDLELGLGDSVSVSGVCVTAQALPAFGFSADLSPETCQVTSLGDLTPGARVNLERALRLDSRLGGHLVTGHVDGFGEVVELTPATDAQKLVVRAPDELLAFLAPKGSVVLDGVSLTINRVRGALLEIMLIPHTRNVTTLGSLTLGQRLNLEVDPIARHVVHYLRSQSTP